MSEVTLVSKAGDKFTVKKEISQMSKLIAGMIENDPDGKEDIPVACSTRVLAAFTEYAMHYNYSKLETTIVAPLPSSDPKDWLQDEFEREFVVSKDQDFIMELLEASNLLDCPALFELCCAAVAAEFKEKEFDEIKKKYLLDDIEFTPEDEAEVLADHGWIITMSEERVKKLKQDMGGI
jgi:Skp1 family, dimerisation domain/Skp1 family, tetramerisation domain